MTFDKKLLVLILITVISVLGMIFEPSKSSPSLTRYIFSGIGQFLIILVAAIIGFDRIKSFTFKSAIGKSLLLISFGLLSWGLGALIWFYYNIASQTEVPYPSLADIGFLGTIPLAAFGLFWLLKNIKIEFDKKTIFKLAIIPIIVFLFTYWLFIHTKLAEDVPTLEKILNVTYPMGDVVFLSFTFVILSLVKGGKLFKSIGIICVGFIVQAAADFSFSWTTAVGTYYTGSFPDILFALAFFALGLGMYYTKEMK
jgi:hypothetical protein